MRPYLPFDYPEIASWYEARGEFPPADDTLPPLGFIVPNVAVGFLYRTDAPALAMLEGFCTNPAAPLRERYRALGAIVDALAEHAKLIGFRCVVGLTRSTGMAALVGRRHFRKIGRYTMLQREA
jgi:hypothetical protein